jgi:hypothetical protein
MSPIEKQRAKVAALRAEQQRTEAEAATDLAAHSAFVLSDDSEEAAFGSAKAAALLRKAGESRVRADSLTYVLGQAEKQLLDAERAEEKRLLAVQWKGADGHSSAWPTRRTWPQHAPRWRARTPDLLRRTRAW